MHLPNPLQKLAQQRVGAAEFSVEELPAHASPRKRWRIRTGDRTFMAVFNPEPREVTSFVELSGHFSALGLPVPRILDVDYDGNCYLEEDLGGATLLDHLQNSRNGPDHMPEDAEAFYREALTYLVRFQVEGIRGLRDEWLFPFVRFDGASMRADLEAFREKFLGPAEIPHDTAKLQRDFERFVSFAEKAGTEFLMYRDFQARNIMVGDRGLAFIDFQNARRGPAQYDVISLLYQSRARIPEDVRTRLLEHYLDRFVAASGMPRERFLEHFPALTLVRLLQMLSVYGREGLLSDKEYFRLAIRHGISNLGTLLSKHGLPVDAPELSLVLDRVVISKWGLPAGPRLPLAVRIQSFSYKGKIPEEGAPHHGGFVFDCRALPNPGRQAQFKKISAHDTRVRDFLDGSREVWEYSNRCNRIVLDAVRAYRERGFDALSVAFGCTGGMHRSVYCAERLAEELAKLDGVSVELRHRELATNGRRT